jgi:cell division septum initiation protein DivIVA
VTRPTATSRVAAPPASAEEPGAAPAPEPPGRAPVAAGADPHDVAGVPRPQPHGAQLTGMDRGTEQAAELVIDLLDAIESLVVNGRRVPFSAAVMVNEDETLDYVDRARGALPDDVKRARAVVERQRELIAEAEEHAGRLVAAAEADGERIAAMAREEAERIVAAAHAEAQRLAQTAREHAAALVSTHAITIAAEQRAEEIAARAAADADAERAQADAYARDLLAGLTAQVEKALGQLHRGLEMLPVEEEPLVMVAGQRRRR